MCLAVPAQIVEIEGDRGVVELVGVRRDCVLSFVPGIQVGDYVLLHAGFAIRKWELEDVREYEAILSEMKGLDDE